MNNYQYFYENEEEILKRRLEKARVRGFSLRILFEYLDEKEKIIEFMKGCKIIDMKENLHIMPVFETEQFRLIRNDSQEYKYNGAGMKVICENPSIMFEHPENKKRYIVLMKVLENSWDLLEVVYDE